MPVEFANDTEVVGLISNNHERANLEGVEKLTVWCMATTSPLVVGGGRVEFQWTG